MRKFLLTKKFKEATEEPESYFPNLRDLGVLRGVRCLSFFGYGFAAL